MMKDLGKSLNLAVTIILCIVAGLAVGYGIDSIAKTSPTFMIVGLLLGTGCAFMALYNMASKK